MGVFCSRVSCCLAPFLGEARFPGDAPLPGDGARGLPLGAAAGGGPEDWACWALSALRGESAPRGDLRGEFLGEFLGEAPALEGDWRRPGDPRSEGRVLGETERKPPPGDREGDLAFDGERER